MSNRQQYKPEYYQLSTDDKIKYHINLINTAYYQRYDSVCGTSICLDNAKRLVEILKQRNKEHKPCTLSNKRLVEILKQRNKEVLNNE